MSALTGRNTKIVLATALILSALILVPKQTTEPPEPATTTTIPDGITIKTDEKTAILYNTVQLVEESTPESCAQVEKIIRENPGLKPVMSDVCYLRLSIENRDNRFCSKMSSLKNREYCLNITPRGSHNNET